MEGVKLQTSRQWHTKYIYIWYRSSRMLETMDQPPRQSAWGGTRAPRTLRLGHQKWEEEAAIYRPKLAYTPVYIGVHARVGSWVVWFCCNGRPSSSATWQNHHTRLCVKGHTPVWSWKPSRSLQNILCSKSCHTCPCAMGDMGVYRWFVLFLSSIWLGRSSGTCFVMHSYLWSSGFFGFSLF